MSLIDKLLNLTSHPLSIWGCFYKMEEKIKKIRGVNGGRPPKNPELGKKIKTSITLRSDHFFNPLLVADKSGTIEKALDLFFLSLTEER